MNLIGIFALVINKSGFFHFTFPMIIENRKIFRIMGYVSDASCGSIGIKKFNYGKWKPRR